MAVAFDGRRIRKNFEIIPESFMHYQPLTESDRQEIFKEIGVSSFAELLKGIPQALRNPKLDVPEALSEFDIQRLINQLGSLNATTKDHLSFLGGGSYDHFIPSAVPQ